MFSAVLQLRKSGKLDMSNTRGKKGFPTEMIYAQAQVCCCFYV